MSDEQAEIATQQPGDDADVKPDLVRRRSVADGLEPMMMEEEGPIEMKAEEVKLEPTVPIIHYQVDLL